MYKCDICGRESSKKIRLGGYTLCSKHMHQLHKYGYFLDDNPRTNNDLNDYIIIDDIAVFNLYNQKNEKVGEFVVDVDDIEKVKYHKWRLSHNHVITGLPSAGTQRELSHIIFDIPKEEDQTVVGHINCNPCDNRKKNLRICEQGDNVCNKSFMSNNTSVFIGVSYAKHRDAYDPEIRKDLTRCHLGYQKTLEEAVYARYLAEGIVFGEYCNEEEHMKKYLFTRYLDEDVKARIFDTVKEKLINKGLWQ